jgi:hypothetical protein
MNIFHFRAIPFQIVLLFGMMVFTTISNAAEEKPAKKADKPPLVAKSPEELGRNLFEALKNKEHKYQLACTYDMIKGRLEKDKASDDLKKRTQAQMNLWNIGFAIWNYEQKKDAEKDGFDWSKIELIKVTPAEVVLKNGQRSLESIQIRIRVKDQANKELTINSPAATELEDGWYFTPRSKHSDKDAGNK